MKTLRETLLSELSKVIKEQDECQKVLGLPHSDAYKWMLRLEYARGRTSGIAQAIELLDEHL